MLDCLGSVSDSNQFFIIPITVKTVKASGELLIQFLSFCNSVQYLLLPASFLATKT